MISKMTQEVYGRVKELLRNKNVYGNNYNRNRPIKGDVI